jgi:hypothetical protein
MLLFRVGVGYQTTIFKRADRKSVEIRSSFYLGGNLNFAKPNYILVYRQNLFGTKYQESVKYDPTKYSIDSISGKGSLTDGLFETKIYPGFYIEKMSFKGLQKRAKKTEINEKTGKFKNKKRFGKSISNKSPAMFVSLLKQKVYQLNGLFYEINTVEAKASQYNHVKDEYVKKKLSERWSLLDEDLKIQRDLYSAFLIQNINDDLKKIDKLKCEDKFNQFKVMHDEEIGKVKLLDRKPVSMGV